MSVDLKTPDFDFSGFYYPELVEAQIQYLRKNVPEISNENPFEPAIQLVRAFALIGHLSNTLLDMVAHETTLPTAKLRDSVVRLVALIGYVPHANIPSTATLRAKLNQGLSTATLIVPDNALFGTRREANTPPILFESDGSITVAATNALGLFYTLDYSGPTWVNETTDANTDASTFDLFSGIANGDSFYAMHVDTMTDELDFSGFVTASDLGDDRAASPRILVYEYFDGEVEDDEPDSVINNGSNLTFVLDSLLGTSAERSGQYATVTLNATGVSEELLVTHDGTNNVITTTGFLGQTAPSTTTDDYTVGVYWHELSVTDTTKATIPVTGEVAAAGNSSLQTFTGTLARYPLEPDTDIVFTYNAATVAKTATFKADGTLSGDADTGTTVNRETGVFTLNTISVPDTANIFVAYSREQQPFQKNGSVAFAVPKDADDDWIEGSLSTYLNSGLGSPPATSGLWLRCRIVSLGDTPSATAPKYDRVKWDQGSMYITIPVTQGRTFSGEVLGSGDGTADQAFAAKNSPVIEDSVLVTVDGDEWTEVSDFASSTSTDKDYIVRVDSDGIATITFGDGTNGATPGTGTNNVVVEYRVGGGEDGNVGAGKIRVNRSGLSRIKAPTNPRPASGWTQQEGASDDTLAKLKRDAVASLRTLERAVSLSDVETLAVKWRYDVTKQIPFSRARAIQNGFGLKTVKLVTVPTGAGTSSPTVRAALDAYFNGNLHTGGDEPGVMVANTEVTSVDYTQKVINVAVVVTGGNKEAIETAISGLIHPESLQTDGITYRWSFGATVTLSKLNNTVFGSDPDIEDVAISSPASDTILADDELPILGTLSVVVI